MRYIELLPPEKRPVAGSEGAAYRRQQMARQLPEHDQDPSKCHELSPAEVKQMQQYVRKYKDEALGVGDVLLPEEMAMVQAGGKGGDGVGAGGIPAAGGTAFGPGGGSPAAAAAGAGGGVGGAGYNPAVGVAGAGSVPGVAAPGARAGVGGAGSLSGSGIGLSAGYGPAGGAMGTAATAGAMTIPGAQQAGIPQQNFVRSFHLSFIYLSIMSHLSVSHCHCPDHVVYTSIQAKVNGLKYYPSDKIIFYNSVG